MSARDESAELAAVVAELGALPMPVGPEPRCVEDELAGANLSLYEEGLENARLRLALASAQRGRRELRARVAELEAAAYGDAEVRLLTPVEQIRHLHACVAVQLSRADTLDRLCREQRARADEAEDSPLAWAEKLDAKSLDNFLVALGSFSEHEPMDEAVDRIHELLRSYREATSVEEPSDKLTALLVPAQALREDADVEEVGQRVEWCTGCNTDHDPDQCGYQPETGGA